MNVKVFDNAVRLPKLGLVECRVSKQACAESFRPHFTSGKHFVSLCCSDVEIEKLEGVGEKVGLDVGLKALALPKAKGQ